MDDLSELTMISIGLDMADCSHLNGIYFCYSIMPGEGELGRSTMRTGPVCGENYPGRREIMHGV